MSLRDDVRSMQARLNRSGLDAGPEDGIVGKMTVAAVNAALDRLEPAAQRTSPRGIAAIAAHEGFVPGPYRDSRGILTAWIGHTANAGGIDPADLPRGPAPDLDAALEAGIATFASDLRRYEDRVRRAFTRPLAQHQFDAAVSFDFHTGGIHRATWVQSFNEGHDAKAAREIMNWRSPASIIPRREAEQQMFRAGVYPDKPMPIWGVTPGGAVIWRASRYVPAAEVAAMVAAA